jgi:hypothetical protein
MPNSRPRTTAQASILAGRFAPGSRLRRFGHRMARVYPFIVSARHAAEKVKKSETSLS